MMWRNLAVESRTILYIAVKECLGLTSAGKPARSLKFQWYKDIFIEPRNNCKQYMQYLTFLVLFLVACPSSHQVLSCLMLLPTHQPIAQHCIPFTNRRSDWANQTRLLSSIWALMSITYKTTGCISYPQLSLPTIIALMPLLALHHSMLRRVPTIALRSLFRLSQLTDLSEICPIQRRMPNSRWSSRLQLSSTGRMLPQLSRSTQYVDKVPQVWGWGHGSVIRQNTQTKIPSKKLDHRFYKPQMAIKWIGTHVKGQTVRVHG